LAIVLIPRDKVRKMEKTLLQKHLVSTGYASGPETRALVTQFESNAYQNSEGRLGDCQGGAE
jgi:hypothetical protein